MTVVRLRGALLIALLAPLALPTAWAGEREDVKALYEAGESYRRSGQRVSALLTFLRYLAVDHESERAKAAAQKARALITQGVSDEGDGKVTISISPGSLEEELGPLSLALSISVAAWRQDDNHGKPQAQLLAETLATLFAVADESDAAQTPNCVPCAEHLPFFVALARQDLTEPFAYVALSSLQLPGSAAWLASHAPRVEALERWLAARASS